MSGATNLAPLLVRGSSNFEGLIDPGSGRWKYPSIVALPCEHTITEELVKACLTANTQCPIVNCHQAIQTFVPGLPLHTFDQIVHSTPETDPSYNHESLAEHIRSAAPDTDAKIPDLEPEVANEDPVRQFQMGLAYYKNRDYHNAVIWFSLSANQRNPSAMRELALCYTMGQGVQASSDESDAWLAEAKKVEQEEHEGEEFRPQQQQRQKPCPCCSIS